MDFFSLKNIIYNFGLFYVNDYPFLIIVWNLFLAIMPFFIFLAWRDYWQKTKFKKNWQKLIAGIIFFLWLLFLPNAAYLIVGIRHLLGFCPADSLNSVCLANAWEIMYFFVFSVLGWVFFVIFLKQMKALLAEIFSPKTSEIAVVILIPIVSLGVLLGLLERFNSWDIFYNPLAIFQNLLKYMADWQYLGNFLVFTAGYYILYYLGDYLFSKK